MSPAHIITRHTDRGAPRYVVRFRMGGRIFKLVHGGSFRTMKEARIRRDLIAGEIAAGRDPRPMLAELRKKAPAGPVTFKELSAQWLSRRVDVAETTHAQLTTRARRLDAKWGNDDPTLITPAEVADWVAEIAATLAPGTVRNYFVQLRSVLDDLPGDNPARSPQVRLPQIRLEIPNPPSRKDVDLIHAHVSARYKLPVRVLEQTGCRIGELIDLEWGDVDLAENRFRVREGKTHAARRWVAFTQWIGDEIAATCPFDDRSPDKRVFPGIGHSGIQAAMRRACKTAGIAHYHPHDLRHRYASVQIARGVPVTDLAAQLGHARKTMTLDTYSHVLLLEEDR